jgi:uncharacterized membrane protein YbjE (DUF340 family)
MLNSLIIGILFVLGVLLAQWGLFPENFPAGKLMEWVLFLLMFFVGLSFGSYPRLREIIRSIKPRLLLVPVSTILGTFMGITIYNLIFSFTDPLDAFAIGSGFGYYSLSSILISKYSGELIATIALLSNVMREIITLIFAPQLKMFFGKLAPISSGGATSMDTTLPVITKVSGIDYMVISLLHGIILTILVPFIITFLYEGFQTG